MICVLCVFLEIPVPHLENMTPWLDVFPTESVKLSCGMQGGSGWTFTWYKAGEKVQADDAVSFDLDGSTLSISSASAKHEGPYKCRGHLQDRSVSNYSSTLTLTVYGEVSFKCVIVNKFDWLIDLNLHTNKYTQWSMYTFTKADQSYTWLSCYWSRNIKEKRKWSDNQRFCDKCAIWGEFIKGNLFSLSWVLTFWGISPWGLDKYLIKVHLVTCLHTDWRVI